MLTILRSAHCRLVLGKEGAPPAQERDRHQSKDIVAVLFDSSPPQNSSTTLPPTIPANLFRLVLTLMA